MARKKQRIYTILGAAVGTGLAVYGIRQGIRWYQRRQMDDQYGTQLPGSAWPAERRYQHIDLPEVEQIPTTGSMTSDPPMTGMTAAERVNSDMVSDFDDRGTAFTTSEISGTQEEELTSNASPETGMMPGGERYGAAETRSDRDTSTWTGMNRDRTEQQPGMRTGPTSHGTNIVMDEYVAPLIEHAIAFNSVMNLLRSRQREGVGNEGIESLTEGDRTSMRAVLDQMQEKVVGQNETALRSNPLARRSYELTNKLRDALDNHAYSGSDLYRIYDEIRAEICPLANDLDKSGQVTITGIEHIRQLYECR